jgi:hypothetical protein
VWVDGGVCLRGAGAERLHKVTLGIWRQARLSRDYGIDKSWVEAAAMAMALKMKGITVFKLTYPDKG